MCFLTELAWVMLGLGCILQLEQLSSGQGGILHSHAANDHYRAKKAKEVWKPPINRLKGAL